MPKMIPDNEELVCTEDGMIRFVSAPFNVDETE